LMLFPVNKIDVKREEGNRFAAGWAFDRGLYIWC